MPTGHSVRIRRGVHVAPMWRCIRQSCRCCCSQQTGSSLRPPCPAYFPRSPRGSRASRCVVFGNCAAASNRDEDILRTCFALKPAAGRTASSKPRTIVLPNRARTSLPYPTISNKTNGADAEKGEGAWLGGGTWQAKGENRTAALGITHFGRAIQGVAADAPGPHRVSSRCCR